MGVRDKGSSVLVCVHPFIKPVSGLAIKMYYHLTVSRKETNSPSACHLLVSFLFSRSCAPRLHLFRDVEWRCHMNELFFLALVSSFNLMFLLFSSDLIKLPLVLPLFCRQSANRHSVWTDCFLKLSFQELKCKMIQFFF